MAAKRAGMGRGLAAILPEADQSAAGELRELPVGLVKPNPNQPRTQFDQEALDALAASIEMSGVVQPLLVRPLHDGSYELVAGERRWRAAQQAGLDKVPAVVRDSEQAERLQVALIENMVREDLNPVEEARACAALIEELDVSKEDLARRVGRSRPAVSNLIRLLDLPDELLGLLESGELSEGHGKALLAARGNDVRRRLGREAARYGWSVRETENRAKLASQPKARAATKRLDPEEQAALSDAADLLESALGHEVRVRAGKGEEVAVEIRFDDLDEALALARRIGSRRPA
jgi:ParB family transcriptional regulator, chromosome partitioning protein